MIKGALFVILTVAVLSFGGFAFAYEGGTKLVAEINQSEIGTLNERGPIQLASSHQLAPTKPIVRFLREMPKPTLSTQGMRQENRRHSTGTKASVEFLGGGF